MDKERELKIKEEIYNLLLLESQTLLFAYEPLSDTLDCSYCGANNERQTKKVENFIADITNSQIIFYEHWQQFRDIFAAAACSYTDGEFDFKANFNQVGYRWYRATYKSLISADGNVDAVIGKVVDIDKIKVGELQAAEQRKYLQAVISSSLFVFDFSLLYLDYSLISINEDKAKDFYDWERYAALWQNLDLLHPEDVERYKQSWNIKLLRQRYFSGERSFSGQYRLKKLDGQWAWVSLTIHLMEGEELGEIKSIVYWQIIDDKQLLENALRQKAEIDMMTGLHNRRSSEELVTQAIVNDKGQHFSVFAVFDVDDFKSVNDCYGHPMGDRVLRGVAQKAKSSLRHIDIIGRIGGDEFCFLMRDILGHEVAEERAALLCSRIHSLGEELGLDLLVSLSIGLTVVKSEDKNFDDVFVKADKALYRAKAKGKDGYSF